MSESKARHITLIAIALQVIVCLHIVVFMIVSDSKRILNRGNELRVTYLIVLAVFLCVGAGIILGVFFKRIFYTFIAVELTCTALFFLVYFITALSFPDEIMYEEAAFILLIMLLLAAPPGFYLINRRIERSKIRKEYEPAGKAEERKTELSG